MITAQRNRVRHTSQLEPIRAEILRQNSLTQGLVNVAHRGRHRLARHRHVAPGSRSCRTARDTSGASVLFEADVQQQIERRAGDMSCIHSNAMLDRCTSIARALNGDVGLASPEKCELQLSSWNGCKAIARSLRGR